MEVEVGQTQDFALRWADKLYLRTTLCAEGCSVLLILLTHETHLSVRKSHSIWLHVRNNNKHGFRRSFETASD
jgi:hypothetical protein